MKNRGIEKIKSKIRIAIKGKNVKRFLLRLHHNRINILDIHHQNKDEAYILIYFKDYEKVLKINTIYEIYIISYGGLEQKKRSFNKNKVLVLSIAFALVLIYFLSKLIFKVEIITNDHKMRDKLLYELSVYDLKKFKLQKSYSDIQKIKEELLIKYKDEIEWLEIELVGTRYIVRYEPRIINKEESILKNRHIVASKNAIVYAVESSKGQVLKYKNDYVSKGDIIISGHIYLNEEIKDTVSAQGKVYGETWYEVDIFYPLEYYEEKKTGREKNVYVVKFLNWRMELFNFKKFYDKITIEDIILSNRVIPFKLVKEHQVEIKTKSAIQTVEEATEEAISLAITKMENKLSDNEYIIKYRVIDKNIVEDGVNLKIFFSVVEDITAYEEIKEEAKEEFYE